MSRAEPHFEPWVGHTFGVGRLGERRLLLLGEAHYSDDPAADYPGLTKDLVGGVWSNARNVPFFTKVSEVVKQAAGFDDTSDARQIWDAVAFYNFIPGLAASAARVRPTAQMWLAGGPPFEAVLDWVEPARVLVLGADLWNHLSERFLPGWTSEAVQVSEPIFRWSSPSRGQVLATWIDHPASFGFSPAHWVGRASSLLSTQGNA